MNELSVTAPRVAPSAVAVIRLPEKPSLRLCQEFSPNADRVPEARVVSTPPLLFFAIDHAPVSATRSW